jgi:hypothetical protein
VKLRLDYEPRILALLGRLSVKIPISENTAAEKLKASDNSLKYWREDFNIYKEIVNNILDQ